MSSPPKNILCQVGLNTKQLLIQLDTSVPFLFSDLTEMNISQKFSVLTHDPL